MESIFPKECKHFQKLFYIGTKSHFPPEKKNRFFHILKFYIMIEINTVYKIIPLRLPPLPCHPWLGRCSWLSNISNKIREKIYFRTIILHSSGLALLLYFTWATSIYHENQNDKSLDNILHNCTVCMWCPMYEYLGKIKRYFRLDAYMRKMPSFFHKIFTSRSNDFKWVTKVRKD